MNLADLKTLAESFRPIADDKTAVAKLADDTINAKPTDTDVKELCGRYKRAADGNAVRVICDEVKARTP